MADNSAQENIQGVEIHLVKINNNKGKKSDVMDTSGTTIQGGAASLPTPRRSVMTRTRQIM